jgi:sugar phosphate isomerase/epimerase
MRLGKSDAHLTYCTNIHPGETWAEVRENLGRHVLAVKALVAPDRPFGVGLRLSSVAARALAAPAERAALRAFLRDHQLYVFTVNAFPYGPFHGQPVKQDVYLPDWRDPERVHYSDLVADLLADLLPGDGDLPGSISTVPGGFRPHAAGQGLAQMARGIAQHAVTLFKLRQQGKAQLGLALEPEPACAFETTRELATFLTEQVYGGAGRAHFAAATGLLPGPAEAALRRHVGVCLDACHAAVEFEEPTEGVDLLAAAGVPIFKLQVSAGLRIQRPDAEKLRALQRFAEGVYLHQVVIRRGADLERLVDLPEALSKYAGGNAGNAGDEWRVHFHVPLFQRSLGLFENTGDFLATLLARAARQPFTPHLEVETYTWDVLPEELRRQPVHEAVARELAWTLNALEDVP